MSRNGDLNEEKVIEPVGIDLNFSAVFQTINRRPALPQVMHARPQIRAGAVQAQKMGLENTGNALPHRVEVTRREYERRV